MNLNSFADVEKFQHLVAMHPHAAIMQIDSENVKIEKIIYQDEKGIFPIILNNEKHNLEGTYLVFLPNVDVVEARDICAQIIIDNQIPIYKPVEEPPDAPSTGISPARRAILDHQIPVDDIIRYMIAWNNEKNNNGK